MAAIAERLCKGGSGRRKENPVRVQRLIGRPNPILFVRARTLAHPCRPGGAGRISREMSRGAPCTSHNLSQKMLQQERPHVIVATPALVMSLVELNLISLSALRVLVCASLASGDSVYTLLGSSSALPHPH